MQRSELVILLAGIGLLFIGQIHKIVQTGVVVFGQDHQIVHGGKCIAGFIFGKHALADAGVHLHLYLRVVLDNTNELDILSR